MYWDPLGLVATSAAMMVIFLCAAVSFLGYKVCVLDSDEHDEIETELAESLRATWEPESGVQVAGGSSFHGMHPTIIALGIDLEGPHAPRLGGRQWPMSCRHVNITLDTKNVGICASPSWLLWRPCVCGFTCFYASCDARV